jgi:hypothetical protein
MEGGFNGKLLGWQVALMEKFHDSSMPRWHHGLMAL